MTRLLSIIRMIGYGVAIGLVAFATYVLVGGLVLARDPKYLQGLVGAFMGALFAFLFIRFGETLTRLGRRRVEDYNGLVRLEYSLNDVMNLYQENVQLVDEAIRRCDRQTSMATLPAILPFTFSKFPVEREVLLSLTDLDLVNEMFSLNVELRRINDTVGLFQEGIARVEAWTGDGKLGQEYYRAAPAMLRRELSDFRGFLVAGFDRAINALAVVRLLSRNRPFLVRLIALLTRSRLSSRQLAMKGQEVAKIHEEILSVQKRQEERLKKAGLGVQGLGPESR
jgi:hypothetical protein